MDPEYERRLLRQPNGRSPLSNSVSIKLLLVSDTVSPSKVYGIRLLHCSSGRGGGVLGYISYGEVRMRPNFETQKKSRYAKENPKKVQQPKT